MNTFITAIPLFNGDMTVEAYRLCTRDGNKLFGSIEDHRDIGQALMSPALDLLGVLGIEPFAGDKPLFVEFNQFLLLTDMPQKMNVDPANLVCMLPADTPDDDAIVAKCRELKELGYRIAFIGCPEKPAKHRIIALANYLMMDYKNPDFIAELKVEAPLLEGKRLVVENVPDMTGFEKLKPVGNVLLTGTFYSKPITKGISDISPLKVNQLRLLKEINNEDFDLPTIAAVIERDPSLSISLLRFINSVAVGLPTQVTSIRAAVPILGQQEIRRWAIVATSMQLAEDRPNEITKLSLVRAKFAENLAPYYNLGRYSATLFLTGLFSLLDVILQKPMLLAIEEISLEDLAKQALVEHSGPYFEVLEMIYAYERADWDRSSINMIRNDVSLAQINMAFVDALIWYKELLTSME